MVEYFGAKMQRWIPAKVLKRNGDGTYDLDCKVNVPPAKVRKAGESSSGENNRLRPQMDFFCYSGAICLDFFFVFAFWE